MPFLTTQHPPISTILTLDLCLNTLAWSKWDKAQFGNGWGSPTETMSARSDRLRNVSAFWDFLARRLDWLEPYHTQLAVEHDLARAQTTAAKELAQIVADDKLVDDTIERTEEAAGKRV